MISLHTIPKRHDSSLDVSTVAPSKLSVITWSSGDSSFYETCKAIAVGTSGRVIGGWSDGVMFNAFSTGGGITASINSPGLVTGAGAGLNKYFLCDAGGIRVSVTGTDVNWQVVSAITGIKSFSSDQYYILGGGIGGNIVMSQDGITWSSLIKIPGGNILSVANYSNGIYMVAGTSNLLARSTNLNTWVGVTPKFTSSSVDNIVNITYSNIDKRFVAIRRDGCISISPDGTVWSAIVPINDDGLSTAVVNCAVYSNINTTTPAYVLGCNSGVVYVSYDLLKWKRVVLGLSLSGATNNTTNILTLATNGNGAFYLGGTDRAVACFTLQP